MLEQRPLLALVCSILILFGTSDSLAGISAASRVVVEIDTRAEKAVKARLTRRLIALEIREVEVPPAPGEEAPGRDRSLFVRVVGAEDGRLRVELWEHGVFHGARHLSTSTESSQRLRSRRIALAAAELARRLRRQRLAEAFRRAQDYARDDKAKIQTGAPPPVARVALRAATHAAAVGPGNLYLAGPELAGVIRSRSGASLQLSMGWLFGTAPPLAGSTGVRWLEVAVTPSYTAALGRGVELDVGAAAAAAALNFSGAAAVDDIPGQPATWSAPRGTQPAEMHAPVTPG